MAEEDVQGLEEGTDEAEDQGPESGYSQSFYDGILKDAPEEHRPILEPYIKKFDSSVQRRFQDLHGELNPYRELGSYEDLQQMAAIVDILNNEPERVFQALKEQLYPEEKAQKPAAETTDIPGLPPELMDKLNKVDSLEETLQKIAEYMVQENQTKQQAQEDRELDLYMSRLHDEFGDFNDRFVLTALANGVDAEEAIKEWNSIIDERIKAVQESTAGLPPILSSSGGSAVPAEVQNIGRIPGKDLRNFVADILSQSGQNSQ